MENEDLTILAASLHSAIVEGWDLQNQRQIAASKGPMQIDMSKIRMKMSGGQYAVGKGINAPVDPKTGVPIVGAG